MDGRRALIEDLAVELRRVRAGPSVRAGREGSPDGFAGAVVRDLSLRVAAGERVALLGKNGVGKTTLLRLIAGLDAPDAGEVHSRGPVGYVAQDFHASLLPWLRVRDNIALPLRARPTTAREVESRVGEAAALVQLDPGLLARRPSELSGGERQRVALARALAGRPRTLLLDEPLSALDVAARIAVRRALSRWADATSATVLLVTHDLDDAAELARRALVLAGRPLRVAAEIALDGAVPPALRDTLLAEAR